MTDNTIKWVTMLLAVGVIVLGVLAFQSQPAVISGALNSPDNPQVMVSGEAQSKETPDEAVLYLSTRTMGRDVALAQEQNKETMNTVLTALKELGLTDEELQTDNYRVYQESNWDYQLNKQVKGSYVVSHRLVVTTKNIEKVGVFLDAAIKAGANDVDSVQFKLSDEKQKEVELRLLGEATTDAKERAQTLADASGNKLGSIVSISQASSHTPVYYDDYRALSASVEMAMDQSATTVNPQDVTVTTSVNAVYSLK